MCGEMPCPVNGMCRNRSSGCSIPGDISGHFLLKENIYPHVLAEVARAVAGNPAPRLLDLGCGTGSLAALVLEGVPGARLSCVFCQAEVNGNITRN